MPAALKLRDVEYGRLIPRTSFIKVVNGRSRRFWRCDCKCGGGTEVEASNIKSGHIRSCGCLQRESAAAAHYVHGGKGTHEYNVWKGMRQRCNNSKNPNYKNYGGRGIAICARWKSFTNFLSDMGKCPDGLTLERKDNKGGYSPENCSWANRRAQARNTRRNRVIVIEGVAASLAEWSEASGLDRMVISHRIGKLKWSKYKAVTTPLLRQRKTVFLDRTLGDSPL